MPTIDEEAIRRAVSTVAPDAPFTVVRGMRDGGSPWLVTLTGADVPGAVVVRVGSTDDVGLLRTEAAALRYAAAHDLPVPRLLAADLDADPPTLVVERVPGRSTIPVDPPVHRLRELGRAAARVHALVPEPDADLPPRRQPIAGVDFAALRRAAPPRPLLVGAETRIADRPVPVPTGLVHGDLWQGNALWDGDRLAGLIDWDCAGVGAPGVDLGSLRCDAAMCFGPGVADEVLRGWEEVAGHPAGDVAYWDVVACLSTPPGMDWFVGAIAGQGRGDLTRDVLVERRDAHLRDALDRL